MRWLSEKMTVCCCLFLFSSFFSLKDFENRRYAERLIIVSKAIVAGSVTRDTQYHVVSAGRRYPGGKYYGWSSDWQAILPYTDLASLSIIVRKSRLWG